MPGKNSASISGAMKPCDTPTVTILGSGTCVPSLKRSACAVLVEIAGQHLLLDVGPGTMSRLLAAGLKIHDISHLFLSHFHPDHSGELAPFIFSYKYGAQNANRRGFTVMAGNGLMKFYHGLKAVYGPWIETDGTWPLSFLEASASGTDHREFSGFSVTTVPVAHNPESIAFRIAASNGVSVVYSGDTDYCENLVSLARHADVFICESSTPDREKIKGHMTPRLAGRTARLARVGTLVLTHFYPACETADIAAECRTEYAGPLVLAEDLMVLHTTRQAP